MKWSVGSGEFPSKLQSKAGEDTNCWFDWNEFASDFLRATYCRSTIAARSESIRVSLPCKDCCGLLSEGVRGEFWGDSISVMCKAICKGLIL